MIILLRLIRRFIIGLTLSLGGFTGIAYADDIHLNKADIKALYTKVQSCWTLPPEVEKDKNLHVVVKFQLDKSGKVVGNLEASSSANTSNAKGQAEMIASAKRAIVGCQPYNLPAEKYQSWSEIEFHFSTKDF